VVAQDYPYKGISICDDASTDDSVSRVLRNMSDVRTHVNNEEKTIHEGLYRGVHCVLTVLKQNGMQGRARNYAINIVSSRADYFGVLDSDDMLRPTKFSKCVKILEKDKDAIGACYTDYTCVHVNNNDLSIREFKEPYNRERLMKECIVHSGCVISKRALEIVGLFEIDVCPVEDYSMWLKISKRFIIVHIPEDLVTVRVHKDNCTFSVPSERWQKAWRTVMERHVINDRTK